MKKLLCVLLSILMVFSACSVITGVVFATTYSVSAAAGGTASVNGNTYTATPSYGNTFAGW